MKKISKFGLLLYIACSSLEFVSTYPPDFSIASPRFRNHVRSKQEVIMGDELRLGCQAIGKPTPYVHWYKNGQLILPWPESTTFDRLNPLASDRFGKDDDSTTIKEHYKDPDRIKTSRFFLKFKKIESGDEGEYACKVWNQAGQIWRNFTVHIVDLPAKRTLHVPQYDYEMLHDRKEVEKWLGEPLDAPSSKKFNNENENDVEDPKSPFNRKHFSSKSSKDLNNLPMMDGTLTAFNNKLNHSSTKPIVTHAAPYWTKPDNELLQTVATPAGRQVKLSCRANGKPEPSVIWYKNHVEIKTETERPVGLRYQIKKWALILEDVVPSDKGVYTCVAFNEMGNISHNYTLNVVERLPVRPIISPEYPKNMTVFLGDNATFECPVLSDLQPDIRWIKHCAVNGSYKVDCGDYISSDIREPNDSYDDDYDLPDPMVLTINNVSRTDEGWYSCLAGNYIGTSIASAYLTVIPRNDTIPPKIETADAQYTALVALITILVAVLIVVLLIYVRYNRNYKIKQALAMLEDGHFDESSALVKKVIKVYRSESDVTDQTTLLPKITITPRYQSGRFKQDFSLQCDYEMPLDADWEICRDDVSLIKSCGEGAFGQVYVSELRLKKHGKDDGEAENLPEAGDQYDHVTVAVKMLKDNATERELIDLVSEMEVMKQICKPPRHSNIINMIGCCTQNGPLYVIVEYCALGNLLNFLRDLRPQPQATCNYEEPNSKRHSKKVLTTQDLVQYSLQVARGMKYLSDKKCIHRDLAARNVLVSEDYVLKIGDFGLARDIAEYDYYRKTSEGRLPIKWMAPECLSDRRYTMKSDVWSYGVLLWEIMTLGGKPYPSVPFENLYQILKQGHRMNQPHNCPNEIYSLMLNCWQENPNDRWSFAQIERYLDDLIASNSEEYVEVIPDYLAPIDDDNDGADQNGDNEMEPNETSPCLGLKPEAKDNKPGELYPGTIVPASLVHQQTFLSPNTGQFSYNAICGTQLSSPVNRTALRPISETSEFFDMQTDEEDVGSLRSTCRKSRPSATDSGVPTSPGCSLFDGSSDSVDSKCSSGGCTSSASSGTVFQQRSVKRHSDPTSSNSNYSTACKHKSSELTAEVISVHDSTLNSHGSVLASSDQSNQSTNDRWPSSDCDWTSGEASQSKLIAPTMKSCDWPLPANRTNSINRRICSVYAEWPKPPAPQTIDHQNLLPPDGAALRKMSSTRAEEEDGRNHGAKISNYTTKGEELEYADLFRCSRESVV